MNPPAEGKTVLAAEAPALPGWLRRAARVFTFPATRRLTQRYLGPQGSRRRLFAAAAGWWALAHAVVVTYAPLRGAADDAGAPVHGASLERGIFGGLPTLWLQDALWKNGSELLEWTTVLVHTSWFVVPLLAAIFITVRRPAKVGSFFRWWIAVELLALPLFALFPMRPPWMESDQVVRIIALRFGGEIADSNPVAAMPSLHVAFPFVIALWFRKERWMAPFVVMLGYTALIAFEVVYSGEHYVIDAVGAVAFGLGIAALSRVDLAAAFRRARAGLERFGAQLLPRLKPATSERGQALIEFALVLPIILVFLLTLVDFGIALDQREVIQHAAREGARKGAVGWSVTDIEDEVVNQSQGILTEDNITVCYVDVDGDGSAFDAGDNARVMIEYDYEFSIGAGELLTVFGAPVPSIEMTPEAEARLESSVSGGVECT